VVIGILLAFQLNKCSDENKNKKIIKSHLHQIYQETKINKKYLAQGIKKSENTLAKFDSIFLYLDKEIFYSKINSFIFELLIYNETILRKNAYISLTESGDFELIKDYKTKQQIIDLYEHYNWLKEVNEISEKVWETNFYPYLQRHFDFLGAEVQKEEVYQNKEFKNIIYSYSITTGTKLREYKECLKKIDLYLEHFLCNEVEQKDLAESGTQSINKFKGSASYNCDHLFMKICTFNAY